MRDRLLRVNGRFGGRGLLIIVGLTVLFGVNHGLWHWILGGLLLASLLVDVMPAGRTWLQRRRQRGARQ
jgi:hypothetical protein